MKSLLALLVSALPGFSQSVIELNHQPATFTNLQGRVYQDVQLDRATLDGVIYSTPDGATVGMVKYADLSTNFLTSLKIPADRIQIAAQRQAALAAQKIQYDEAVRALALKEQQDALANTNAVSAPPPAAAQTMTADTKPVKSVKTKRRKKNG